MTTCQTFVFDFVTSLHNNKLAHLLHNTHQHKHNHAHCHNKWQQQQKQQQHRQRRTKVCKESNTSHVLTTRCRAVGCGWWTRATGGPHTWSVAGGVFSRHFRRFSTIVERGDFLTHSPTLHHPSSSNSWPRRQLVVPKLVLSLSLLVLLLK